jgi:hypothetical protein
MRRKDFDLYYKNRYGEFVAIGEAYDEKVELFLLRLFQRKKMKYFITFVDALSMQDKLTPSANKLLRFFSLAMNYGNKLTNHSLRDIQQCTGLNMRYVMSGIDKLVEHDVIRIEKFKNRRTYMVNPTYMYRGNLKKIFYAVKEYDKIGKVAFDGSLEWEGERTDG